MLRRRRLLRGSRGPCNVPRSDHARGSALKYTEAGPKVGSQRAWTLVCLCHAPSRPGRRPRPPAPAAGTATWSNPSRHLLPTPRCPGRAGRPKVLDMRRPRARSGLPGGPGLPMVEGAASDGPGRRRREAAARHLFARLHRGPAGLGDLGDPS